VVHIKRNKKSMVKKNYFHNVIRLRKGKPSASQVYWIIVILNSKKTSSHKQVEQLGFFKHGPKRLFSINYERLAHFLNKGFKLKNSVLKFIF
jgi:ribosomal protein S16